MKREENIPNRGSSRSLERIRTEIAWAVRKLNKLAKQDSFAVKARTLAAQSYENFLIFSSTGCEVMICVHDHGNEGGKECSYDI